MSLAIETKLVHAGERRTAPTGVSAVTPIYPTTSFVYERAEDVDRIVEGEINDFVYSRYGNPTTAAFESAIAELEGGNFAFAFGSGMAALHAALLACELSAGSVVLASRDLYGASLELLRSVFGAFGVKTVTADFGDLEHLGRQAVELNPRVLIAETISNPLLKVLDVEGVARIARECGARFVVDNTFATPFICRPLELGADLVVHSATKFLAGHADATGGAVVARDEFDRPALNAALTLAGGILSPWEAHSILRGIKTLALRLEKQCSNALKLARYFESSPFVADVIYPGFGDDFETSERNLLGGRRGAVLAIRLIDDTRTAAYRFMNSLGLVTRAASVGDIFTGVVHPATATHRELSPAQRTRLGITDGLLRVSAGVEDADDLIADFEKAFSGSTFQAISTEFETAEARK